MIDMLRIINIMVRTNRDKNRDKLKISEKNENIWEILESFKERTGSWSDLAKKIYYEMFEDDPALKGSEEKDIIKKFSQNLSKAVKRKQEYTTVGGERLYLSDVCSHFELTYQKTLTAIDIDFDQESYIASNIYLLNERQAPDWNNFLKYLDIINDYAIRGIVEAQTFLAHFYYYHGENEVRNVNKAVQLYKEAASQNDKFALYQLGRIYEYGDEGVSRDENQAFKYYKKAADKNFNLALNKLAYCYYQGIGTPKNMSKFFEYAKRCESVDDIVGKLYLAFAYSNGIGTNESPSDAIKIYETLLTIEDAKQYKMEILWALCKLYKSEGEYQDLTKAEEYFKNSLDTYSEHMTQAWEMNVIDIVWNIFTPTPERYNGILKNAHYDYVNKPDRPMVIRALFGEYESK